MTAMAALDERRLRLDFIDEDEVELDDIEDEGPLMLVELFPSYFKL